MRQLDISVPLLYSSTNKVYGKMENVEVSEYDSFYNYKDLRKLLEQNGFN